MRQELACKYVAEEGRVMGRAKERGERGNGPTEVLMKEKGLRMKRRRKDESGHSQPGIEAWEGKTLHKDNYTGSQLLYAMIASLSLGHIHHFGTRQKGKTAILKSYYTKRV
eukprot:scaffold140047_cov12-Tisochrysis_lutea.AAC.1